MTTEQSALPEVPLEMVTQLSQNWWVLLLRGIFLLILGIYALTAPAITLAVYCQILGFFLLADSLVAFVLWFTRKMESRGWMLIRALLTMLVGIFVIAHPLLVGAAVVVTLVMILALHSLLSGALEIYVAIRDRKAIQGEGWMMLSGAFSILFGFVLLSRPLLSAALFIRISGFMAIAYGIAVIFTSLRWKSLKG
ncbi:DUF308 domain-containing protein [Kiritimatiellaeota bacterium B1221]|nr:DUF308 domain-containing protein [Kiritimatiellaeota bacterium B1221]